MTTTLRTGMGYDLHRTTPDRPLVLGGVRIECDFGLEGHSDADVVLHALCDAMLGAAGLGDIGELFPDDDPAFRDADSRGFVREVLKRMHDAGFDLVNADVVIHAERPKLRDQKETIRKTLGELLEIPQDAIGVKATTNEGLDAIGRGEAIACFATVLLERSS